MDVRRRGRRGMRNRRARGATGRRLVGGRDGDEEPAVAHEHAEARGVVGEEPAGDGDERARAAARRRDEQAVGAVRLDDRELVHDVREVAAARARRSSCPCSTRPRTAGRRGRARSRSTRRASTARSNEARSCVAGRTSSINSTGVRRRVSFWRIIRCPRRAVDRQCTWRRSSPGAYSRSVMEVAARLDARPHRGVVAVEVEAADLGRRHDVVDARVDDHLLGPEHARGSRRRARTDR